METICLLTNDPSKASTLYEQESNPRIAPNPTFLANDPIPAGNSPKLGVALTDTSLYTSSMSPYSYTIRRREVVIWAPGQSEADKLFAKLVEDFKR